MCALKKDACIIALQLFCMVMYQELYYLSYLRLRTPQQAGWMAQERLHRTKGLPTETSPYFKVLLVVSLLIYQIFASGMRMACRTEMIRRNPCMDRSSLEILAELLQGMPEHSLLDCSVNSKLLC